MPESAYMRQREEWLSRHPEWEAEHPGETLPWPPPCDVPSPLAEPEEE